MRVVVPGVRSDGITTPVVPVRVQCPCGRVELADAGATRLPATVAQPGAQIEKAVLVNHIGDAALGCLGERDERYIAPLIGVRGENIPDFQHTHGYGVRRIDDREARHIEVAPVEGDIRNAITLWTARCEVAGQVHRLQVGESGLCPQCACGYAERQKPSYCASPHHRYLLSDGYFHYTPSLQGFARGGAISTFRLRRRVRG
jgi:hypothetical protein